MPPVVDPTPPPAPRPDPAGSPPRPGPKGQTTEAALAVFDQLEPVAPEELLGSWRGERHGEAVPLMAQEGLRQEEGRAGGEGLKAGLGDGLHPGQGGAVEQEIGRAHV